MGGSLDISWLGTNHIAGGMLVREAEGVKVTITYFKHTWKKLNSRTMPYIKSDNIIMYI